MKLTAKEGKMSRKQPNPEPPDITKKPKPPPEPPLNPIYYKPLHGSTATGIEPSLFPEAAKAFWQAVKESNPYIKDTWPQCGYYGWSIKVITDCGMNPGTFLVKGQVEKESLYIAELLLEESKHNNT